jgi:hypothetical protein
VWGFGQVLRQLWGLIRGDEIGQMQNFFPTRGALRRLCRRTQSAVVVSGAMARTLITGST